MADLQTTSTDAEPILPAVPEIIPPVVSWSMDSSQGPVQGPLDLGFFHDHTLGLDLTGSQVALITREGRLSRLFLAGHHNLAVGSGPGFLSCGQQLVFLDMDQPFRCRWSRSDRIVWGAGAGRPLLGEAAVKIKAPRTFFATFLAGNLHPDPEFVERLVTQVVRSTLSRAMEKSLPGAEDMEFEALQQELQKIEAGILDADLEPCGLQGAELSLYTLPDQTRGNAALVTWPETAGHSMVMRHN